MNQTIFWHNLSLKQTIKELKVNCSNGLSKKEVKVRQKLVGLNKLAEEQTLSQLKIFLSQFKNPLVYILLIAGFITLILKEYTDSTVIFAAVFLNTIVGYFQENKASKALSALKKIVKHKAQVIREGNTILVDSKELVPGDIFILSPGNKVPADGKLIETFNLKINEMALTGEWLPAKKNLDVLEKDIPLADRNNMVYMGTIIESGKAKAIVTETGLKTEIGKITKLLKETKEEETPLQKKIGYLSKSIGIIIAIVSFFIFLAGVISGRGFIEMFTMAVAIAVAAIPEGLPIATTVILALGMERILKKKGLVKKLLAAETLGSTSIIASDKTATITEGKMHVSQILTPYQIFKKGEYHKDSTQLFALKIAALCSDAFIENPKEIMEEWIIRGGPTSRALLLAAIEAGVNRERLEKQMTKIDEIPFNSINKYSLVLYKGKSKKDLQFYICGAPEKILNSSKYIEIKGKNKKITKKEFEILNSELEKIAKKGLRIVAVGYKKTNFKKLKLEKEINNFVFIGFIALKDPIRKGIKQAIKKCLMAGLKPILVTGDHKLTAKAIANEIGILATKKTILEGKDLDKISDDEFFKKIESINVYTRVEPRHKMRIIRTWQEKNQIVAMTGDGINDAPALKKADIGVAIGSGTDVAKEVSDLILLTDNFNIIVAAVEEGRAIVDNIRKVITYLLSDSFTEITLIGGSIMLGWPLPITAVQILWVNLIEDGLPSIALAFEPQEKDIMKRKPEGRDIHLLTKEMKVIIVIIGITTNLALFALFFWLFNKWGIEDIKYIRTMIFAALTINSLLYVFSCKSLKKNIWNTDLFSNKLLIYTFFLSFFLIFIALYLPIFQTLLKTVPLNFFDWSIVIGLGIIQIILIEIIKWYFINKK